MNELCFLGRASGYDSKEGNTSAYIKLNKALLLIDCGETVFKRILKSKLLNGIKEVHILITHMHSDHVGSLAGFIGYCKWKYGIISNIYFKEKDNIRTYLELLGEREGQSFYIQDVNDKRIESLKLRINTYRTKHVENLNCYSYMIKFDNGNDIFYSRDTYETNIDIIPFLEKGNLIYHDACLYDGENNNHTSLRKLSEEVPNEYRKLVWCMHIDRDNFIEEAKNLGFNVVKVID